VELSRSLIELKAKQAMQREEDGGREVCAEEGTSQPCILIASCNYV
jgi:hypothetical protein